MASNYGLGQHYDDFIRTLVESGRYASPSEVMRDSLRLMEQRERLRDAKLAALRADITEGLESGFGDLSMNETKRAARREWQDGADATRHDA